MIVGISTVRDEVDIIEATVTHMQTQVDRVIVADNGSTDGTLKILLGLVMENDRLIVTRDKDPAHYQSRKMTALALKARELYGAEWIVPFDADEVWISPHGRIADVLAECPEAVATAPIYNHCATGADDLSLPPVTRMGWRTREPLGLPKVACRPALPVTIAEGNHGASYPEGVAHDLLEVRHFPYRSADQFLSKVRNGSAALAATDLPESVGEHWRMYGELLDREGPEAVKAWFCEHFFTTDPESDPNLIYDPASATRRTAAVR